MRPRRGRHQSLKRQDDSKPDVGAVALSGGLKLGHLAIRPHLRCRMPGATALLHKNGARVLTVTTRVHSSTVIFSKGVSLSAVASAALLTRISTPPRRVSISATQRCTLDSSATSQ